jgi:hypothetical protein
MSKMSTCHDNSNFTFRFLIQFLGSTLSFFGDISSFCAMIRDLLYKVIFQDADRQNAVCWAEKYPETKEPDTLISFGLW